MNGKTHADLIDRVLEGRDAGTKARVLDLIYRLNLDPTDELFLFAIAIGYLETIITDAPAQWRDVFDTFTQNLEPWKTHHLATLETQARLAASLEQMITGLRWQSVFMSDLRATLTAWRQEHENTLPASNGSTPSMQPVLDAIHTLERRLPIPPSGTNTSSTSRKPTATFPTPYPMPTATSSHRRTGSRAARLLIAALLCLSAWLFYGSMPEQCRSGAPFTSSQRKP